MPRLYKGELHTLDNADTSFWNHVISSFQLHLLYNYKFINNLSEWYYTYLYR